LAKSGSARWRSGRVRLATVLAIGAGVAVVVWIYSALFLTPIDDPSYFCNTPDPSPVASISASTILQSCAAGKTITVAKGDTIAVDLLAIVGVDTWSQWTDVTESDGQVLTTVSPPARVAGVPPQRLDEVAVYRATKSGQATLSAVEQFCTANGGGSCRRGHVWNVTVRVS